MSIERIFPEGSPKPRGPYSPAIRAGDFIFVSGQVPVDPATNEISPGDIQHETRLVLQNIQRVLAASGATLADVVKCSVFLADAGEWSQMNEVYKEFFGDTCPARTTVAVGFAAAIKVEIDCVAYKPRL
jgi:2-iminobutanoate/2-iminopropanoate deaminase